MIVYINVSDKKVLVDGVMLDVDFATSSIDPDIKEVTWVNTVGYEVHIDKPFDVGIFNFDSYNYIVDAWNQVAATYTAEQLESMKSQTLIDDLNSRESGMNEFFSSDEYQEMLAELE